ncbi:DNA-3-methyladenine glycosylase I [Levilactobacillus namurensis]|uniref:DNA-3-methyladenine glycosylase I n=1 Tax=Levilactobacillus namurensis TaxID=380393 RepID=UPI001D3783A4|nr:DNA-3-methyladenine glycosylase I [Levilactobacillus namurensis]HJE44405.1 DNA-3-methyladenine glycosylase I [Levilactobacillus namurensis]
MTTRCTWAQSAPKNMQDYHDQEWGRPQHDNQALFELLCLETFQAGLSWQTVLNKRPAFRRAFQGFAIAKVAAMTAADLERLLQDPAIIRNRLKLSAAIHNAQVLMDWPAGSDFSTWLWAFVGNQPIRHRWTASDQVPATTDLAQHISREMKRRGFKFVGPTIVYSLLQAAGLVNDHLVTCDWAPENQHEEGSK